MKKNSNLPRRYATDSDVLIANDEAEFCGRERRRKGCNCFGDRPVGARGGVQYATTATFLDTEDETWHPVWVCRNCGAIEKRIVRVSARRRRIRKLLNDLSK